jgi:hypothetical protein
MHSTLQHAGGNTTKVNADKVKEVHLQEDLKEESSPDPFPKEVRETSDGYCILPKRARNKKRPSRVARQETIVKQRPTKVLPEYPLKTKVGTEILPPAKEIDPLPVEEFEKKREMQTKRDSPDYTTRRIYDLQLTGCTFPIHMIFAAILGICLLLVTAQLVNSTGTCWCRLGEGDHPPHKYSNLSTHECRKNFLASVGRQGQSNPHCDQACEETPSRNKSGNPMRMPTCHKPLLHRLERWESDGTETPSSRNWACGRDVTEEQKQNIHNW